MSETADGRVLTGELLPDSDDAPSNADFEMATSIVRPFLSENRDHFEVMPGDALRGDALRGDAFQLAADIAFGLMRARHRNRNTSKNRGIT